MQNTRAITFSRAAAVLLRLLFQVPVTFFSLLLIWNTLPYFSFSKQFDFISERSLLFRSDLYNACFYLHIAAGAICIGTALIQFSRYLLKRSRVLHRISGRLYVGVVLLLGAPTGLYMSFFAKGSFWERSLFLFMAGWWFISTFKGLQSIRNKNILAHKLWMIRSYAMALTAVSFRLFHLLFYMTGWDHLENYEVSLWISVLGNLLVAEWIIQRQSRGYLQSFQS